MSAEAERQRAFLRALHDRRESTVSRLEGLPGRPGRAVSPEAGLGAYRAHAQAVAERALAAAYPTVQQLLGGESFAALAHALWRRQPPLRGDLAWFGEGLAELLAETAALAGEAYLPDAARLDWAVHRAASAADHDAPVAGLPLLAEAEPASLRGVFVPGTTLLHSRHPVVAVWQAHQPAAALGGDEPAGPGDARFAPVRAAFAAGRRDHALVWRRGWRVEVERLPAPDAHFTRHLLAGASLGQALESAGSLEQDEEADAAGFDFEGWLLRGLREGWLAGFEVEAGHGP
ncbi:MAG TPA: putative DNA-binding domain-containing protein [Ideonella sp.]|nr:putative DNA-binding domain-containing protein [Ideonella sp.]